MEVKYLRSMNFLGQKVQKNQETLTGKMNLIFKKSNLFCMQIRWRYLSANFPLKKRFIFKKVIDMKKLEWYINSG